MPGIVKSLDNKLIREFAGNTTIIEPWGENSFRVRSVMMGYSLEPAFALTEVIPNLKAEIKTWIEKQYVVSKMPGERLIEAQ